jgi:hypothetical protein
LATSWRATPIRLKFVIGADRWSEMIPAQLILSTSLMAGLGLSIYVVSTVRKPRLKRRALAARLAEKRDIRSIGAHVDSLYLDDLPTRDIAARALTELLPQLLRATRRF